jgi:hypothetical protein
MMKPISEVLRSVLAPVPMNHIDCQVSYNLVQMVVSCGSTERAGEPIGQFGPLTYVFISRQHPKVIDWLMNECQWRYSIFTALDSTSKTYLVFFSRQGSIEFKTRFI